MEELQRTTPAAGQANGGAFENGQGNYSTAEQKLTTNSAAYPYYNTVEDTAPARVLSLAELAWLAASGPTVRPKTKAAALTPFRADGKRKELAVESLFYALVTDHDDDDKSADEIRATYDRWDVAYLAYTSASHEQDKHGVVAKRWKPVIPLAYPVDYEQYKILSEGLMLLNGTDAVQSRSQQVFFAPNVIEEGAPFDYIDETERPFLNPHDDSHPLVKACTEAYEAETARQEAEASKAAPKPRPANVTSEQGRIIDKVKAAYAGTETAILEHYGYKRIGRKYLSPQSSTGNPGVLVLSSGRVLSYHGETDPLSSLNHDGHALDVFDLLCALRFGGDFSRAVAELANEVDEEGQKQRQRDHMAAKEAEQALAEFKAMFENQPEPETEQPKPAGVDLLNPPGLAGEICKYMKLTARRPRPELYPFAALHLMALVGRNRKSVFTNKLNLMTLAIAPTATGKEKAQDAVKRLARDQYCSDRVLGNAGSFRDLIYNLLDGDGASLYIVDEVHSLLGTMQSKNAQTYESKMEAEILTMFGTELYTFRGMEKRSLMEIYQKQASQVEKALDEAQGDTEKAEILERTLDKAKRRLDWLENGLPDPFFSLMGHSVPERLDSFIKTDNIASGFLGRTLITRCPDTREKLRRAPVDEHALALCEFNITNGLTEIRQGGTTIAPDEDAADYLDECIDWYEEDDQLNHHIAGGIYARAPEHLYRVATILALEEGTITLEHARYAHALVKQSIDDVSYILLKAYNDGQGAQERHVMELARQTVHRNAKGTGATHSRLKQLVTKPKGWQELQAQDVKRDLFQELIERMITAGELEKQTSGRRERYLSRAVV